MNTEILLQYELSILRQQVAAYQRLQSLAGAHQLIQQLLADQAKPAPEEEKADNENT